MRKLIPLFFLTIACGVQENPETPVLNAPNPDLERLKTQIADLQGTQSQINSLILSDWSSCAAGGSDALTTFQQNICRISQAATIEETLKNRGAIAQMTQNLQNEITRLSDKLDATPSSTDVNQLKIDLYGNSTGATCASPLAGSVCFKINDLVTRVTNLESTVNNPTTGVGALNTAVTNINSTLSSVINGAMLKITIGQENLSAGPFYEDVLRNPNRSNITAYLEDISANVTINNNGCATTNGSPTVTITTAAVHGMIAGNVVKLNGMTSCNGISSGAMNGQYTVVSAPTTSTFTFTAPTNATSNGTGGGNNGYIFQIRARGLGQAWKTADGEVLLTTTGNNMPYNFVVTSAASTFTAAPGGTLPAGWAGLVPGSGYVCYSITSRVSTAANIKLGGANIRCY